MKRREFLKAGAFSAVLAGSSSMAVAQSSQTPRAKGAPFQLNYAPYFGMFSHHAGADEIAQLEFMQAEGFRAIEDNNMAMRPLDQQKRIASALERLQMTMGVFLANHKTFRFEPLPSGDADARQTFLDEIKASLEVAKRFNAKWMVVVPGRENPTLDRSLQLATVIDALKRAVDIIDGQGVGILLEPVSRVHGRLVLNDVASAYEVAKAVGSPSCKILCDFFHQQYERGNLLETFDAAWDELAYFQVADVPSRREPMSGEINYGLIFAYLKAKGYSGIVGMEHGNSKPGKDGERALIDLYRTLDAITFENQGKTLHQLFDRWEPTV